MSKKTKDETNYRKTRSANRNCHECKSMNADGSCKKVEGIVKPDYVCDLWGAKPWRG
jgi:hypothetical protein